MCDTVCLIVEVLRIKTVEVLQYIVFQNFGMKRRNAVYTVRSDDSQMCHVNLSVTNDRNIVKNIIMTVVRKIIAEPPVNLFNDHINTRQQFFDILYRPFFKCFRHDRMVCIGNRIFYDIPCLIPVIFKVIQQHTHQFRHA